ncbi:MAG: SCO7613 C-terminal domain-containing membrane protein [Microbacteriaceae bacterium]
MPQPWSDEAIRHLLDATNCPRCGTDGLHDRRCLNCGADLRGEIADRLWAASSAAVTALRARQEVLDLVPVSPVTAPVAVAAAVGAPATVAEPAAAASAPTVERSSATVQSVLAVAGAGLFAVAAIVFTFFNPDLTDEVLRSAIVGVVTVIFLGGAWLLARRGLQFSAEAVGALGMVFVALDVAALRHLATGGVSAWVFTAIGTLVSGIVMIGVARLARIRSWLLLALAGMAFVPAMIGYAGYDGGLGVWPMVLGHLSAGFAVLALLELVRRLAPRFDGRLTAERVTLTALQVLAVAAVVVQLPLTDAPTTGGHWLAIAGALAALAVLAALATRHLIAPFWSYLAGGFAVSAIATTPFALDLEQPEWYLALVPAAAGLALIALGALPTPRSVVRPVLTAGVLTIAAIASVITVFFGAGIVLFRAFSALQTSNYGPEDLLGRDAGIAVVIGLVAVAGGLAANAALGSRRSGSFGVGYRIASAAAVSLVMLGGLAFASWSQWLPVTQVSIAIGFALAVALLLLFVPVVRDAPLVLRLPAIVGAHLALLLGGLVSWGDEQLTVPAGVAIVAVLFAVAATVRTADHPVHVGVGYAYALVLVARALDLTDALSTVAVFSITTAVGAVGAIAATLIRRLRAPAWYAVLIVTAVPFLIGVGVVVVDRSGWAALSSGLIFCLALTLLLTRRPGLNIVLRAISAGLLVPTLAVVVTNLAAQFLETSGSPVALPVIAVIVAGVLPSTALIRAGLVRHGLSEREASVARIWIEATALLTGAIAVVLALVRQAAGLDTSFIVLVVLGIGAAAAAIWGRRRYGWWVAFASFTGALWCIWAQQGVTLIEPYLLPPAIALAIIGVIVTARGGNGVPLYATGLGVSVIPMLGILAVVGSGDSVSVPWRAYALLAAAWVLLLIGAVIGRGSRPWMQRLAVLRTPTLAAAIIASSAGTIQALRFGLSLDDLPVDALGLLVSLGFGAAGAVAAGAAARVLLDNADPDTRIGRSRWLYAPAVAYVAIASWTARPGHFDWVSIWTLWGLMLALLIFMVVIVLRTRARATTLPPVWMVFALAFVTAIVGWSARDLRVEVFSVPLGLFLLAAGVLVMLGGRETLATANNWPVGHTGSWRLLGPGIVVLFLASVLASGTDPTIWRAIGVIAAALLSILVGAQLKLAAPFILGIVVLPVENVVVFAVQIVRGIDSIPWWITLAIVGAVLLIIAVTYERRSGADNSVAARLRDLR